MEAGSMGLKARRRSRPELSPGPDTHGETGWNPERLQHRARHRSPLMGKARAETGVPSCRSEADWESIGGRRAASVEWLPPSDV